MRNLLLRTTALAVALAAASAMPALAQSALARPMTFLDVQQMRTIGSPTLSPDGKSMLYTLSTMDW